MARLRAPPPAFAAALVAALLLSCTSPHAFLAATDLAGAYPVALLWGCAPPLMALRARARRRGGGGDGRGGGASASTLRARLGDAALLALAAASAAFVAANAAADTQRWLGVGAGLARWERPAIG